MNGKTGEASKQHLYSAYKHSGRTMLKEQSRLSLNSYGRPRMTEELKELGLEVGHRRVGRLMRQNNISMIRTRKHKITTDSNHKFNIAPNLLNRNFVADQANQKWPLGDCMQSPAGNSR